jgi:co-chaperonin GroES (HSP10)
MMRDEAWQRHVEGLLDEARSKFSIYAIPTGPRLAVYPLMVDEDRLVMPVHLHKELPDIGLVVAVSWEANAQAFAQLAALNPGDQAIAADAAVWSIGDVVLMNRFSGMAVPETDLIVIRTDDVFMKIRGLPLRLKKRGDWRSQEGNERRVQKVLPAP